MLRENSSCKHVLSTCVPTWGREAGDTEGNEMLGTLGLPSSYLKAGRNQAEMFFLAQAAPR